MLKLISSTGKPSVSSIVTWPQPQFQPQATIVVATVEVMALAKRLAVEVGPVGSQDAALVRVRVQVVDEVRTFTTVKVLPNMLTEVVEMLHWDSSRKGCTSRLTRSKERTSHDREGRMFTGGYLQSCR